MLYQGFFIVATVNSLFLHVHLIIHFFVFVQHVQFSTPLYQNQSDLGQTFIIKWFTGSPTFFTCNHNKNNIWLFLWEAITFFNF